MMRRAVRPPSSSSGHSSCCCRSSETILLLLAKRRLGWRTAPLNAIIRNEAPRALRLRRTANHIPPPGSRTTPAVRASASSSWTFWDHSEDEPRRTTPERRRKRGFPHIPALFAARAFSTESRHSEQGQQVLGGPDDNDTDDGTASPRGGTTNKGNSTTAPWIAGGIQDQLHVLKDLPLEDVRSFCFIAHVDHGKSSLSSRILELAGNLGRDSQRAAWVAAAVTGGEHGGPTSPARKKEGGKSSSSSSTTVGDTIPVASSSALSSAPSSSSSSSNHKERIELMDTLAVERQRGITVKASTATMLYPHPSAIGPSGLLLLNLYDTPGHADFGLEVTRSLSFVQGAVLLLDATQGIQAQTWSVYDKAKSLPHPPKLMVALTKVDLEAARPVHVALSASDWLGVDDPDAILLTSARNRIGIKELLDAVCRVVPPPQRLPDDNNESSTVLRVQVVDSWYDSRGVNCLVQVLSGELREGDRISLLPRGGGGAIAAAAATSASQVQSYPVQEVGIVLPHPLRTHSLRIGQMGYVRFGLRDPRQALPGTILIWSHQAGQPMYLPESNRTADPATSRSVLYASVHPRESNGFDDLCRAVDRLALNDTGLEVQRTSSVGGDSSDQRGGGAGGNGGGPYLGPGLRVGFQGLLHVEVFRQRLLDEFEIEAIVTPPKVPYVVTEQPGRRHGGPSAEPRTRVIEDLAQWPDGTMKFSVQEPMVLARIVARVEDAGAVMELVQRKRGTGLETKPIDEEKWLFTAQIPWAECVGDFHDVLKNVTSGYGSVDLSEGDPPLKEAKLCKVDLLLNNEVVEPLSFVCHVDAAQSEGRSVCQRLQSVLPRQQFVTVIQARANGKIVASERIRAFRKDVLTKSGKTVGGGDMTRKKKLLEKQKEGKKRMQESGRVSLSQEAFNSVISRS